MHEPENSNLEETSSINITPFIDVMLVLLIVFMVAAPLSTVSTDVDLPAISAEAIPRVTEPVYITIQADDMIMVGTKSATLSTLVQEIQSVLKDDRQKRLHIKADKTVVYGHIMDVFNVLRTAGYQKIALVGIEKVPETDQRTLDHPEQNRK